MNRRENLAKQRRLDPIGREAGIPLTGQIAHDRYVIENRQKDQCRAGVEKDPQSPCRNRSPSASSSATMAATSSAE